MRSWYELAILRFSGELFSSGCQGAETDGRFFPRMQQGFNNFNDMAKLFQRSYGLKEIDPSVDSSAQTWEKAIEEFQETWVKLAGQWGWVSAEEHKKVLEKCAELEKEVDEKKIMIDQLRELLAQEGMGHAELFKHLQDSINEQSAQFHELMRTFGNPEKEQG
jgi:uncharacterized protein YdiU (UPF0061 family)